MRLLCICILLLLASSCDDALFHKNEAAKCPSFDIVPSSPYEDPIWHPSGQIIGFNHKPIKGIKYSYGYDCPHQATYIYEEDSTGFWLINADGSNKRRVLPFTLFSPAWSPDGEWIAFMHESQIFKMTFNGADFDTTAIVQLTFQGRNFFPSWSPDKKLIAYDNTECGSATTPVPADRCGILVMDVNGENVRYVGRGRKPYWGTSSKYVYSAGTRYDLSSGESVTFFDPVSHHVSIYKMGFNPDATIIGFIGNYTNTETQFPKLFSMTQHGESLQTISDTNIMDFSWAPDGRIVYLNYDYIRIDSINGTLWVMNKDGTNQQQLTFNNFQITY